MNDYQHGFCMTDNGQPTQFLSRRSVLGACGVAGTACLAGCTSSGSLEAETTVTREYDGVDISEFTVETTNGDIDIREEQRETVSVEATKHAVDEDALSDVTLVEDRTGERLSLSVESDDSGLLSFGTAPRMDLVIAVPDRLNITTESTNGDIDIGSKSAERLNAESTNGDIAFWLANSSDIQANTTNGDVSITLPATAEPSVSFETTNGEVATSGLEAGSIEADSEIDQTIGNGTHRIRVDTTNGNLRIQGEN